ncbi:MAG: carboxypeptidase-like regulatory domain-containing protein, partial [Flavobacterium sp.]|nr:carboxypeptidase-like regulatory domain-containing protein [Flavobacterium sp.]
IHTDIEVNNIIKKVIENRKLNDPEKRLESFQYKNYEYAQVTANPDSISSKIDTIYKKSFFGKPTMKLDSTNYKFKKFSEKQHLYQTEKVNLIQHHQKKSKETILATRMAGFEQPIYEYLGLKLISYSAYENPFEILEIPVQNPISNFGRRLYNYKLVDTVKIDGRNTYRIYFEPKKLNTNRLRGLLYIDTQNYAISQAYFRIYGVVNINATYTFDYKKEHAIWFPKNRKFKVSKGNNHEDIKILGGTIKFSSNLEDIKSNNATDHAFVVIESTPFDIEINKKVDISKPRVKIDIPESSLKRDNEYWNAFKKDTLDKRKLRTYTSIDSLSLSEKIEHKVFLGRKIINGYFPISIFDIDLRSIVKYNNFEGFRLGLGAITNSKLSEKYKVAFYGAFGLKDEEFKFGITPSYLADKNTETWVSASYSDDISEIAQTNFVTDARRFRIYDPRPINISTFYNNKLSSIFVESKILANTSSYFGISHNQIQPLFNYTFINNNNIHTQYTITAAQLAFQWNPFSNYMQTPLGKIEYEKRHPKFSLQLTQTLPNILDNDFAFTKIDFKTYYELPYLSGQKSSVLLQTGIAFGDVPITHLYSIVPNNLNKDAILQRITFAGKNSFETMYFNEFFSNRYASLQLKHTFNKVRLGYKINPEFTVVTRIAVGSNNESNQQHLGINYKTLEDGFFESGVECNKIFKGFGLVAFYRYGPNQLPNFDDNIAIKVSYYLDLGF